MFTPHQHCDHQNGTCYVADDVQDEEPTMNDTRACTETGRHDSRQRHAHFDCPVEEEGYHSPLNHDYEPGDSARHSRPEKDCRICGSSKRSHG